MRLPQFEFAIFVEREVAKHGKVSGRAESAGGSDGVDFAVELVRLDVPLKAHERRGRRRFSPCMNDAVSEDEDVREERQNWQNGFPNPESPANAA